MNNNFKKLLASAMALAMVTSVMPMGVDAATTVPYSVVNEVSAKNYIFDLNEATKDTGLGQIKAGDKIAFNVNNDTELNDNGEVMFTVSNGVFTLNETFKIHLEACGVYLPKSSDEWKTIEFLLNLPEALTMMVGQPSGGWTANLTERTRIFLENASNFKNEILTPSSYLQALELNKEFTKLEAYEGNLLDERQDNQYMSANEYLEQKADLTEAIENFTVANYGDELDEYLTDLQEFYEAFVKYETTTGTKDITAKEIEKVVKSIKNGTVDTKYGTFAELTKANYKVFGEDEAVVAIMEQFEALVEDEYQEVRDALDKKNEAYVEYSVKKAVYHGKKQTLENYVITNDFWTVVTTLTQDEFKILKAYKEEVLDVLITLDAKQLGNTYVEKSSKTPYASVAEVNKAVNRVNVLVEINNTNKVNLFAFYDKDNNVRYWDVLEEHFEELQGYLDDLSAIDRLSAKTITEKDAALVEKADESVYKLTNTASVNEYSIFVNNLTAKQAREVDKYERKVEDLLTALENIGYVGLNGWVDLGNGNWDYFKDGKAFTGWVCSAKDTWYYVSNGHMLRDAWVWRDNASAYYVGNDGKMVYGPTTVNGYELDANGLWHK